VRAGHFESGTRNMRAKEGKIPKGKEGQGPIRS